MFSFITGQQGSAAEEELQGVYKSEVDDRCTLLLSPGANTIPMAQGIAGSVSGSNPVRAGYGCAAAAVAAGVVILDGFESTDLVLENGETSDEWKTLNSFPTSPAAQLQDMKLIEKTTSRQAQIKKKQRGTEPSIDIGLNLVAMFRPDGFGNFQGFAGYSLGPYGITVGVQNDADSLEVLNQFGGMRPPFVRFQPKLNFDIEL